MPDPDLEIRGEGRFRPKNKRGGLPKNFFRPIGLQVGLKYGGGGGGPPPGCATGFKQFLDEVFVILPE